MDGDLMLIFGFTLAALWIVFRQPRHREKDRRNRDKGPTDDDRRADAQLQQRLDRLEDRVRVLERIVTDDPQELRRQFRDLGV